MSKKLYFLIFFIYCVSGESCLERLSEMVLNITDFITTGNISNLVLPASTLQNTAKAINQLGFYDQCNKQQDSKYMLTSIKAFNAKFFLGFCGPIECNLTHYKVIEPFISQSMSNYVSNITGSTQDVNIYFQDPDNSIQNMSSASYFTIFLCFFLITIAAIGAIGEIYKEFFNKKEINTIKNDIEKAENIEKNQPVYKIIDQNPEKTDVFYKKLTEEETIQKNSTILNAIICFSPISNIKKLLSTTQSKDQNLDIFNGVRFLSLCWVILGHEYLLRITLSFNINVITDLSQKTGFINIVQSGLYAVDVFFFLGGFFVAYILLQKFEKKVNFIDYFKILAHRILKIWPSYFFCLMFFWKLSAYLGNGPLWNDYTNFVGSCDDNYWKNLLYIDNFYKDDNRCFPWGWYLSNDLQMFLVAPFLIYLYAKNQKKGVIVLSVMLFLSFLSSFLVSYINNFKATPAAMSTVDNAQFFDRYYIKPWIRCDVYILGIMFCCFYNYYRTEGNLEIVKSKFKNSVVLHVFCYVLGLILINSMIFCMVDIQEKGDIHVWNDTQHVFYLIFNRFAFVFGVLLVLLPGVLTGKDFIYKILSFKFFSPLAKLAYCTYLAHFFVLARSIYSTRNSFYATNEAFIYFSLSDLVYSLIAGLILSVFVEIPMMNVIKLFTK